MTCQSVMKVLRKNKDSVMAVLEAFVHDPLLNWRLMENQRAAGNTANAGALAPSAKGKPGARGISPDDEDDDLIVETKPGPDLSLHPERAKGTLRSRLPDCI